MRSLVWFGCLSVWIVFPAFLPPKPLVSRHFRLERLADGVWAAINNTSQGGHAICNAGIIDLGDRTVVFDPFMNLDAAVELRRAAEQLTGRRATWVVNSHHPHDHIRGNPVFLPAAIVSTAWNRREISVTEPRQLQWEREHAAGILAMYRKQLAAARTAKQREDVLLWLGYFEGMVQSGPSIRTSSSAVSGVISGRGSWNTGPAAKGVPSASVRRRDRTVPSASTAWKVIASNRAMRVKK